MASTRVQKAPSLMLHRWGLVPSWTKKGTKPDHFRMVRFLRSMQCCCTFKQTRRFINDKGFLIWPPQFNARSETVAEKSVFSRLLSRQRCIFLAEGFYEWKKVRQRHCSPSSRSMCDASEHALQKCS